MASLHRTLLWLTIAVFSLSVPLPCHAQASKKASPTEDDKAVDKKQMRQIWEALMAYKKAKGKLPGFLSDLVPEYIPNKEALISPVEKRTGRKGNNGFEDPKLPCSYCYEFSATKFFNENRTFREAKEVQMEEFGPVVPILRCFCYDNQVLNVAYSGDLFETLLMWETAPETVELMKTLGMGPGLKNGAFTTLKVVDETGKPVPDANVQLTGRNDNGFPLPNRTLKTDSDGKARIPLASRDGTSHRVVVQAAKPNYFALSESWNQNGYAKERQVVLTSTVGIGGIVKLKGGSPLSGAEIEVNFVGDKAGVKSVRSLTSAKTDAEGRWKCDAVPKDFNALAFVVKHPSISPTKFKSTADGPLSQDALLAGTSEFAIAPAPVISGTVLNSDGVPIANAEVFARPLVLKSTTDGEQAAEPRNDTLRTPEAPIKTDPQGNFSLPWPSDEKVVLTIFADSQAPTQQIISASSATPALEISMEKGRVTTGRLFDYAGKPVSGAEVYLLTLGSNGVPGRKQLATTDSEGHFSWNSAPNRPLTLLFLHKGYAGALKDIGVNTKNEVQVKIAKEVKQ